MYHKPMKKRDYLRGSPSIYKPRRGIPMDRKQYLQQVLATPQTSLNNSSEASSGHVNLCFTLRSVHPEPQRKIISNWKRLHMLGSGSFGAVFLARYNQDVHNNGDVMAVKSAELSCSESLKKEAELLPKFEGSPYIIQCLGAGQTEENGVKCYNVFLEYAPGGSLHDLIKNLRNNGGTGGLPEDEVRNLTRSVLSGLSLIHRSGYVHRDIKPENILLDAAGSAKIADFGLAKVCSKEKTTRTGNFTGTILYMAPEIIKEELYEPPVDVWALGCTVIEMITGRPAWDFPKGTEYCAVVFKMATMVSPEIPKGVSKEAEDFVTKCLKVDPGERWTAEMLLKHPFVAANDHQLNATPLPCMPHEVCRIHQVGCC